MDRRETIYIAGVAPDCRAQALRSIRQEMIAGTVEQETASMVQADGRYNYTVSVQCEEMIARMVRARIKEEET